MVVTKVVFCVEASKVWVRMGEITNIVGLTISYEIMETKKFEQNKVESGKRARQDKNGGDWFLSKWHF